MSSLIDSKRDRVDSLTLELDKLRSEFSDLCRNTAGEEIPTQ